MKPLNFIYDRSYGIMRGVLTILLGVAFVVWPETVKEYIGLCLGTLILLMGIIAIIRSNVGNGAKTLSLLSVNGFFDIIFGLLLIVFREHIVNFLIFLFGFLLLIFGIGSLAETISVRSRLNAPWRIVLLPVIITALGVTMFFLPRESSDLICRVFGAAICIYGFFELNVQIKSRRIKNDMVEEVPFEEIKDDK